ncbi:hypothetical protein CH260_20465 [Rhodococcus sp. 05-2256-B2]|uniref:DUF4913 domain-containing protein n=1 Tax=unclassified Rhodococcus (in: high G+C Gram-positive bacteria) TaxID=192944 RepID=UPI000B9B00CF|nr:MULTISPECIES: DUF4913 domain-containing protein [unclassified Rhodococcus (in: high G+C Gram-positive bacteria)]OZD85321.1 hypothetical protein CH258_13995 [Rhodococcus sp. 05-2256-B4]OZD92467.1 hypothetical protein CH260_20465 [Rhodococcus sp. 05-2256-B2]OZD99307.1 hypothetical protein CH257_00635 [Rhodococcus sp. 05-2256-B3]OZE02831.1 hypothetical protein CH285_12750 [Rhodococcus sp. 05-2256-B1]
MTEYDETSFDETEFDKTTFDETGHDEIPSTDKEKPRRFPTFDAWFDAWFSAIVSRKLSSSPGKNQVFCPSWWEHPEVVVRLHSLWTAWESATAADDDGAAMSGWWVHHADPQLRTMLDAEHGPMYRCSRDSHQNTPALRNEFVAAPPGWFDDLGV